MSDESLRTRAYSRNADLESLLEEINSLLGPTNSLLRTCSPERLSKIMIVGAHRSGSTVFLQWLASTGLVAYPTNILSRFYGAPLVGAKIQRLLTDPQYNFRDEILDFNSPIKFASENGKTRGALSPNEFWYFWRRFLRFEDLDYMPESMIQKTADLEGLRAELNELAEIFEKPFALKGMIMNQNLRVLDKLFEKVIFIWIRRDPIYNIQSALNARRRQFGNLSTWYSFKIKEYPALRDLNPLESVAGQIYAINRAIDVALSTISEDRKIVLNYEDFCQDPASCYVRLVEQLERQKGFIAPPPPYGGVSRFDCKNQWTLEEYSFDEAVAAFERCEKRDDI